MKQKQTLRVEIPGKKAYGYNILIGENLLERADEFVKQYTDANKFLIVTDETVAKLYKDSLKIDKAFWVILKDGEEQKNFDSLKTILDAAVENKLERKDCIIAFGGGVTGDMAGFAAASYMRGCDFIQIPTTLLAQVDSSVGGKVAINHEHGKNLIGAFYQPKVVLADISVLKTLDLRQLKTGLAEVLKYAFIEKSCNNVTLNLFDCFFRKLVFVKNVLTRQHLNDTAILKQVQNDNNVFSSCETLFDFLKQHKNEIFDLKPDVMTKLIDICCTLKACVVNQDETEKGIRAILNLGHTFAHAIENLTNYTVYTHGEAVAMGMKMAFKLSLNKGLVTKDYYDTALGLIDEYEIAPETPDFDKEKFYNEMFLDKKAQNGKVRFVLPNGLFSVTILSDITKEQVFETLQK